MFSHQSFTVFKSIPSLLYYITEEIRSTFQFIWYTFRSHRYVYFVYKHMYIEKSTVYIICCINLSRHKEFRLWVHPHFVKHVLMYSVGVFIYCTKRRQIYEIEFFSNIDFKQTIEFLEKLRITLPKLMLCHFLCRFRINNLNPAYIIKLFSSKCLKILPVQILLLW